MVSRRYLITGSNKGIGFYIVNNVLKYHNQCKTPAIIYLGCRNEALATHAITQIQRAVGQLSAQIELRFVHCDLKSAEIIEQAKKKIRNEVQGLDVLVNNAGMAYKGDAFGVDVARDTIGTNFYGTLAMMDTFLPLLEATGQEPRCINVCSMAGKLHRYPPHLKTKFADAVNSNDQNKVKGLVEEFITGIANDTYAKDGWPKQTYGVSKAAEIASTFIAARQYGGGQNPIFIAACCPGWCRTDMAGPRASKSAEEGADTPFFLACNDLRAISQAHGQFVSDRQVQAWGI